MSGARWSFVHNSLMLVVFLLRIRSISTQCISILSLFSIAVRSVHNIILIETIHPNAHHGMNIGIVYSGRHGISISGCFLLTCYIL